jgi:hypothetical protein
MSPAIRVASVRRGLAMITLAGAGGGRADRVVRSPSTSRSRRGCPQTWWTVIWHPRSCNRCWACSSAVRPMRSQKTSPLRSSSSWWQPAACWSSVDARRGAEARSSSPVIRSCRREGARSVLMSTTRAVVAADASAGRGTFAHAPRRDPEVGQRWSQSELLSQPQVVPYAQPLVVAPSRCVGATDRTSSATRLVSPWARGDDRRLLAHRQPRRCRPRFSPTG